MDKNFIVITLIGYILYFTTKIVLYLVKKEIRIDYLLYASLFMHFMTMFMRMVNLQQFPLVSIADTFIFLGFILVIFHIFVKVDYWGLTLVFLSIILISAGILTSLMIDDSYVPEQLKTVLLPVHVIPTVSGYGFLTVGFIGSLTYVFKKIRYRDKLSEGLSKLENFNFMFILIGYILFTFGALIIGAIWSRITWGRFWGWDPKETSSLFTFLVYSVYLLFRYKQKMDKTKLSLLSIVGYFLMVFTYIGIPLLFYGSHSYKTGH